MGYKRNKFCFIWFLVQFWDLSFSIHIIKNNFDRSLDAILYDHALKIMTHQHPHTDELYNASLPEYLAGITVSVVKLRSATLWKKGANFSDFIIPPKTLPIPYVKRLLIVYHNLGNLSSSYYTLSGYTLLSPLVGFLVYDASSYSNTKNLSKIELNTNGKPITIEFPGSSLLAYQRTKCAKFGSYGQVFLSDVIFPNICCTKSEGRFSIVIPFMKKKKCDLIFWVVGFLGGVLGLILAGFAGMVGVRSLKSKINNQELENEVDEGECLGTYWIDSSKMPRAEVARTKPVLESGTTLPNPKLSWYA